MATREVHRAFESKGAIISLARLLPTKKLPADVQKSKRYKEAEVSIREIDIIEPPVVFHKKDSSGNYMLLDGHMRVQILKGLGRTEVFCLLATDDEAFTYNKMINRLSPIQEHYMIMKALERGVSEETLARNLGLDIDRIKYKRNLLDGICAEVVDIFKARNVPSTTFKILKKMKPMRQINAAELMIGANNYTSAYAKALLGMTPSDQLQRPINKNRKEGLSPEQIASAQTEFMNLDAQYKLAEQSVGTDVLTMLAYRGYLSRILENGEVADYLVKHHPDIYKEFQKITKTSAAEPQEI